jgi:hypothetical protein
MCIENRRGNSQRLQEERTMKETMKSHLRCILAGLLISLPIAACAQCEETEAAGASVLNMTQSLDGITIWISIRTCNACFGCVTPEGMPNYNCDTWCTFDRHLSPTLIVRQWNAEASSWDIIAANGSCDDYTTTSCALSVPAMFKSLLEFGYPYAMAGSCGDELSRQG